MSNCNVGNSLIVLGLDGIIVLSSHISLLATLESSWNCREMERFQEREQLWIRRAKRADHAGEVGEILTMWLREKPEEMSLSPEWIELWEKYAESAGRYLSRARIARIEHALSEISGTDPEIDAICVSPDTRVTILLGAGASAPDPSSIPTVGGLLPELWRRARKIGRDDLDRLAGWCDERGITNIEDLLTAAYIANFAAKNRSITGLLDYFLFRSDRSAEEYGVPSRRRRPPMPEVDASSIALFQDTLQTLFGLLASTMIPARPNPAHDAIVQFVKKHPRTTIVTTNYDGCMDEALLRAKVPLGGSAEAEGILPEGKDGPELVKMHGSINWSYCDSCLEVREFDLLELKRGFDQDRFSYAVLGICKRCLGLRRPLLVPPLSFQFMMFPNLVSLWNLARCRIEESDLLVVVGYSFSEAGTHITKMIDKSLTTKAPQKMVVCDSDSALVSGLRNRLSAHIDNFDVRRVLQAVGSCEVVLPDLLDGFLKETPEEQEPAQGRKPKGKRSRRGRKRA